jgi:hypothetical protein
MELDFDEPMATRVLLGADGTVVTAELGAPQPFEPTAPADHGWYCPFRITGIDDKPWLSFAGGTDGIHAITIALARIGDYLRSRADLRLTFGGDSDLGFPSASQLPLSSGG